MSSSTLHGTPSSPGTPPSDSNLTYHSQHESRQGVFSTQDLYSEAYPLALEAVRADADGDFQSAAQCYFEVYRVKRITWPYRRESWKGTDDHALTTVFFFFGFRFHLILEQIFNRVLERTYAFTKPDMPLMVDWNKETLAIILTNVFCVTITFVSALPRRRVRSRRPKI